MLILMQDPVWDQALPLVLSLYQSPVTWTTLESAGQAFRRVSLSLGLLSPRVGWMVVMGARQSKWLRWDIMLRVFYHN